MYYKSGRHLGFYMIRIRAVPFEFLPFYRSLDMIMPQASLREVGIRQDWQTCGHEATGRFLVRAYTSPRRISLVAGGSSIGSWPKQS